jgi:hypothetical protein
MSDEGAEKVTGHSQLTGRIVGLEEFVFVKEEVDHARKDFVIAGVVGFFVPLQQCNDFVDCRVFVVHLLVNPINLRFDFVGVCDNRQARFNVGIGYQTHKPRMNLETSISDFNACVHVTRIYRSTTMSLKIQIKRDID